MLSGLIEVTIKSRKEDNRTDVVRVVVQGPKYDVYLLEQEVHGLKQSLEINPGQDYEHLDQRLQFNVNHAKTAIELCLHYDKRAMDSGTVSDHSQLPLVYKISN